MYTHKSQKHAQCTHMEANVINSERNGERGKRDPH